MTEIKPIRTDEDHRAALAEIERLFDAKSLCQRRIWRRQSG